MGRRRLPGVRQRAEELRRAGYSYTLISERLGVSKSTLSGWLRDIEYEPNEEVRQRVRDGPLKAAQTNQERARRRTREIKQQAREDLGDLSARDLWLAGVALYWADGTKANEDVRFTNSDPDLIAFMMRWFRDICRVPDERFRVAVHLYPDCDPDEAVSFWASVTQLPETQFYPPRVDRRQGKRSKKRGLLPYGTAHVQILGGSGTGRTLHRRIMGWIDVLREQAGVIQG